MNTATTVSKYDAITEKHVDKFQKDTTAKARAAKEVLETEGIPGTPPTPDDKPLLTLPSGNVTIIECAKKLFEIIAESKTLFMRGGIPHLIHQASNERLELAPLHPSEARSFFEQHARLFAIRVGRDGGPVLKPAICPLDMAAALLTSRPARDLLPHVRGLMNCPVLREINGQLLPSSKGYDPESELFITGGKRPRDIPLETAVLHLMDLLAEFDFQTPSDRSRAVASILTPGLKAARLIRRKVPVDIAEADFSQAGKGYRQRVIAAIYGEILSIVTAREGGVGSIDESLNQRLIAGRPFVQLDNLRGHLNSPHIESFLTAEDEFWARVPHQREVRIDPDKFYLFLTSNGVDITRDLANRSNIIRIRKKPDFLFRQYDEGELLSHVQANQGHYLSCVFSVIRAWHAAGKPRTKETRHDFREWAGILDWIVQQIFRLPPLLDGHEAAQVRVSDPGLVWLRQIAIAIQQAGYLNQEVTASHIVGFGVSAGIDIPGLGPSAMTDTEQKAMAVGRLMKKLFNGHDVLQLEVHRVMRSETKIPRADGGDSNKFSYKFL